MRRASPPIEMLLGFVAGVSTAFFIQQPLIWVLHQLGLTSEPAFSRAVTTPLGVEFLWSRAFWGGAFGTALAAFGTRYELGLAYIAATSLFTFAGRTIADWLVGPLIARSEPVSSVSAVVTPFVVNAVWAPATAVLVIALSLVTGTWASRSPSDLIRQR